MWFNSFSDQKEDKGKSLTANGMAEDFKGKGYVFNPELEAAVDVAIGLGRPLLVSGEPGGGKTELGFAIARRLGISRLYFFSTRSVSEARDLFYTYDAVRRFRDANFREAADKKRSAADYIEYQALGAAILDAQPYANVSHMLDGARAYLHPEDERSKLPKAARHPQRTMVVIDEIDKASRDFPNDVLSEIETLQFAVPELGSTNADAESKRPQTPSFPADALLRPIIVITSNEERQLPDAFLRRCVFHQIQFPDDQQLHTIIKNNLERRLLKTGLDLVLDDDDRIGLLALVGKLRNQPVDKKAGVSEIVDAAFLLASPKDAAPAALGVRLEAAMVALAKLKNDRDILRGLLPPKAG
ncbi:AAA family ATPase [Mesorhizobium sp. M00.F.Ca.ET.186.01.1.1]|nr:AAA family ATPase [bacterium M00.F.Ca.ET.205.01.1.1]TGU54686.1 AAA family ATPase [bacterium M00.F.Ca.ET.152.01.1.1]TGV38536.1 AAA family ATPase [Mesorhizobium sp. M00.F.Ca.ET.186.01.1.1]TGZ44258.1 AAA family ATPase [bacterium M00.F.Ca.ET.162.01.1.1]